MACDLSINQILSAAGAAIFIVYFKCVNGCVHDAGFGDPIEEEGCGGAGKCNWSGSSHAFCQSLLILL